MNKYLEGGSLLEIDGGFPQFYECISNSEQFEIDLWQQIHWLSTNNFYEWIESHNSNTP